MASVTKTFTENDGASYRATWTFVCSVPDVIASGGTFSMVQMSTTAKYVYSGKAYGDAFVGYYAYMGNNYPRDASNSRNTAPMASGTAYTLAQSGWNNPSFYPTTFNTSDYFNSNNPTEPYISVSYKAYQIGANSSKDSAGQVMRNGFNNDYGSAPLSLVTSKIILQAPPTFDSTQVYFDTTDVYANLTIASVDVSNVSVKYGGNIASVAFTIGNQTVTSTTGGTLSIPLNAGGTFTPTVTVTDSRGQVTTKSLDAITVDVYTIPSVSFSVERTDSTGVDDDEGESAVVEANFNWTDVVATLDTPTVSVSNASGTVLSVTSTWYKSRASDGTLSNAISDWSEIVPSDMPVYCLIDNSSHTAFDTQYSYQVSITPNDSEQSGTTITQIVSGAFYTIDFLAGGHGIAFGQACHSDGFECSLPSIFNDDFYFKLDTDTASGTDHDIYTALVALGWDSDVIVN